MDNLNYAGFWWRLLAHIIDVVVFTLVNCIIGLVIGIGIGIVCVAASINKQTMDIICQASGFVIGITVQWLYYSLMESSPWQGTLGKKICKITVTNADGERLSFAHACGRYWAKWISNFTCLVGYIMAGFTARKQALHDMVASTLVLRKFE